MSTKKERFASFVAPDKGCAIAAWALPRYKFYWNIKVKKKERYSPLPTFALQNPPSLSGRQGVDIYQNAISVTTVDTSLKHQGEKDEGISRHNRYIAFVE